MIVDLAAQPAGELPNADIVVVGAGAVGLALAVKLARAGRSVALIEAGPIELSAASQQYFENSKAVGVPHHGLHTGRFRMLGGTTNFWGGQVVPIGRHVFRPRPWLDRDTAWPIEPEALDPFVAEAFELLGMSRQIPDDADVLARLGVALPTLGDDLAYFFTRWLPEPVLPKHFAQDLRSSARLTCYVNAQVAALDLAGHAVAGVELCDPGQRRFEVRGRQVVLANGTVEIARLLLSPLRDGQPAPWSDNSWLGRGFIDHLDVTAGRLEPLDRRRFDGLFQNAVLDGLKYQPKIRLTAEAQERSGSVDIAAHLLFNSSYAEHFANAKIFLRSFLRGRPDLDWRQYPSRLKVLLQVGVPLMLRYLRDNRIYAPIDGGIDLRLTCEQLTVRESGLVATDRCDRSGRRIYDLDWRVDGAEIETMARFAASLGRSLEAAGIARLRIDPRLAARDPGFTSELRDSNHQMGMARMGRSAQDGVVDADLKLFGTDNLYVAGAAVYPSAGFPNPTLTAIALALRLGETLIGRP